MRGEGGCGEEREEGVMRRGCAVRGEGGVW